jgi:glycosyltransferase involved in cell wall biosynthesis
MMPYHVAMPPDDVSVTLAAGLAPYQRTLASSLLQAGMLRRLFDFSPWRDIHIQEPDGEGSLKRIKRFPAYKFSTRAAWWIWRHLPGRVRPQPPVAFNVWLADRLMANWMAPCTIFHGCTASCLVCLRAARRLGSVTLVENASRHPRQWKQIEVEECRLLGVESRDGTGNSAELLLRRRDREFDTCDRIVVPSTVACESFAEMGYGDKTVVVLTGVDTNFYAPKPEVPNGTPLVKKEPPLFRACYVGRVEPAKGLGYLLQAWKRLALPRAQLQLVGAVKPQMESLLKNYAGIGVSLIGFLPPQEVAKRYRESNLFVLPSPNEGLAQVLLEAMASGLPAVATDMTGANDCMENGKEGFIVPARDVDALADAILWCYQHPDESRAMGLNARARIESQFTLDHYNQRQIALYRSLAKMENPA